MTKREWLQAL